MSDQLLEGWVAIGAMFGISASKMRRKKRELIAGGYIFERGNRRGGHTVCAFPSSLRIWAAEKSGKGERL